MSYSVDGFKVPYKRIFQSWRELVGIASHTVLQRDRAFNETAKSRRFQLIIFICTDSERSPTEQCDPDRVFGYPLRRFDIRSAAGLTSQSSDPLKENNTRLLEKSRSAVNGAARPERPQS